MAITKITTAPRPIEEVQKINEIIDGVNSLATVASTGNYTDLINQPTIPTVDQTYDGTSTNAQSGVAISSAIGSVVRLVGIDTSTAISRSLNTNYTATRDCWVFQDQNANNDSVFYVDGVAVSRNYWHAGRTSAKGSALVFVAIGQTWQAAGGTSVVEFGILGDL